MDGVLRVMVSGLEDELKARLSGSKIYAANAKSPSMPNPLVQTTPIEGVSSGNATLPATNQAGVTLPITSQGGTSPQNPTAEPPPLPVVKQGVDVGFAFRGTKRVAQWLARKTRRGKDRK